MEKLSKPTIGIDVSKDHLDAHRLPDGSTRRFANDRAGHSALARWLADGGPVERIVYEATGAYHRAFERVLCDAGLPMAKVNPRQARRFAQATGTLVKTDRVDARMLAAMGMALEPRTLALTNRNLDEMRDLYGARQALVKDRTANLNRQAQCRLDMLKRQLRQRHAQIDRHISAIDARLAELRRNDVELQKRFDILASIPGIGQLTAHVLLIDMPELGTLDARQAASLAGLAPVTRQSGKWHGKTFIQGGRARLRQALYLPALVASRFNPTFKAKYQQFIANGKPAKLALTALMRKLLVLANALLRDNRKWSPNAP